MRWTETTRIVAALLLIGSFVAGYSLFSADEKHLAVYTERNSFNVTVLDREGKEYVGATELLAPLGGSSFVDGKKLRLRIDRADAQFGEGKTGGKVRGNNFDLASPLLVENGHALLPLASVPAVLSSLLDLRSDYHEATRRLFLGNSATHFTAELNKAAPSSLVLTFNNPVSPSISTEGGSMKMVFGREGVVSGNTSWTFEDPLITGMNYSEAASPELTIRGNEPLLATFSEGGKVVTISAAPRLAEAPPAATQAAPATPTAPPTSTPEPAAANQPSATAPAVPPRSRFLIVIDPSHGGDDPGAQLGGKLLEKDITLTLARRLRSQLQNRGIATFILRDSDQGLSLEQRAAATNASHAAIYIGLHAGNFGNGVHVYNAMLAPPASLGSFLPWESAQAAALAASRDLGASAVQELSKSKIVAVVLPAPVRPLNNIVSPAIAIEITPVSDELESINGNAYQESVVAALANAIANARGKLGENH